MELTKNLKKFTKILLRNKKEIKNMTLITFFITIFFSLVYPGDSTISAMLNLFSESGLSGLFNTTNVESPGWILWLSFVFSLLLYFFLAISGINLGSKIIPTVESDCIEMEFSNSTMSPRKLYFRNYFAALISLVLIILPVYCVVLIFSIIHPSFSLFDEITLSFVISFATGIFFISLSSLANMLRFSKSFGKKIGYGYLVFSFILDLLTDSPEYADFANLSINRYLNPTQVLFFGLSTDNFFDIWTPFIVILGISAIFFFIGFGRVSFPDYIEKIKPLKEKRSKFRLNPFEKMFTPRSYLAKKFPIFINQFGKDFKVIVLLIFLISLQQLALFTALPSPGELIQQLNQSNTPIFRAFAQGHTLPTSLLGFLILKFYSALWIFFGIAIALLAARIPTRDVKNTTHDLLFANNISPRKLILSRILSMVINLSILVWSTFFILRGIQSSVNFEIDFQLQSQLFITLWIHYCGLGIFMVGIAMIPIVSKGYYVGVFTLVFFILMAIVPFLNPSVEILKYLSYINYFDPVGMILGEVKFLNASLISLCMLFGACIFTYLMMRFKFAKTDLR